MFYLKTEVDKSRTKCKETDSYLFTFLTESSANHAHFDFSNLICTVFCARVILLLEKTVFCAVLQARAGHFPPLILSRACSAVLHRAAGRAGCSVTVFSEAVTALASQKWQTLFQRLDLLHFGISTVILYK